MTFGSLFAGIGGLDLGLERAGMECRWQVEIDPFCRQVLQKHWPKVPKYGDITKLTGNELESVQLICGGFPCQDLSQAGKRAGIEGGRSGLWFEFARIVGVVGPRFVLIENVPGLLVPGAMRRVVGELAGLGYVGIWRSLRASEFGASHLRKRIFIVAYRKDDGRCGRPDSGADGERQLPASESDQNGILRREPVRCGDDVAYTHRRQRQQRSRSFKNDWAVPGFNSRCDSLGNAANLRLQGLRSDGQQIAGAHGRQRLPMRPDGALACGLRFAPGPADPRWPAILGERPDLAPALVHTKRQPIRDIRGRSGDDQRTDSEVGEIRGISGMHASESGSGDSSEGGTAPPQSEICRMADGIPDRLDGAMRDRTKRLGRLGNAVVPQVAEWIGRRILEMESS